MGVLIVLHQVRRSILRNSGVMKYRLEIQGLRAIAVLAVIAYHMDETLLPGGYLGVDVFFVISGFLIANQLLIRRYHTGLQVQEYFKRRILRIAPALLIVSIATCISGWFYLMPIELKAVFHSLGFASIGLANFYFFWKSDYFEPSFEYQPLMHTWSLSLEEQFYFLIPLLLLIRSARVRYLLLVLLTILSFLVCLSCEDHSQRFYLLHARFWEFGLGAIAAFYTERWRGIYISSPTGILLSGSVLLGFMLLGKEYLLPGFWSLVCVLPTVLFLCSRKLPDWFYGLLRSRPFVLTGNLSYSLYLWHYPVNEIFTVLNSGKWTLGERLFYLFIVFSLSYLSYRMIEQPFRNIEKSSQKRIVLVLILAVVALLTSVTGHYKMGFPEKLSAKSLAFDRMARELPPLRDECLSGFSGYVKPGSSHCIHNKNLPLNAIVWGDSHGEALTQGLAEEFARLGYATGQVTMGRCPPVIGIENSALGNECSRFNKEALDYIQESQVEWVVLVARWPFYLKNGRSTYRYDRGLELYLDTSSGRRPAASVIEIKNQLAKTLDLLKSVDSKVILVHSFVEFPWNVPMRLARLSHLGLLVEASYSIELKEVAHRHDLSSRLLATGGAAAYLHFKPIEYFCSQARGTCTPVHFNRNLYYDDDHLNRYGSVFLAQKLFQELQTLAK